MTKIKTILSFLANVYIKGADIDARDVGKSKGDIWQAWAESHGDKCRLTHALNGTYAILRAELPYRGFVIRYTESDQRPLRVECELGRGTTFSLIIWTEDISDKIMQLLGQQDVIIGDKVFDKAYNIQSSSPSMARALLISENIKSGILKLNPPGLQISENDGIKLLSFTVSFLLDTKELYDEAHVLVCAIIDKLVDMSVIHAN